MAHHSFPGARAESGAEPSELSEVEPERPQLFLVRGQRIAGFVVEGRPMVCLPQIYDVFLKHLVGGLHTIYTKLRRLNVTPLICNVEQVRALRIAGAIQCGVNRCKLIGLADLDVLLSDCEDTSCIETTQSAFPLSIRPGRPAKRAMSTSSAEFMANDNRDLLSFRGASGGHQFDVLSQASPLTSNICAFPFLKDLFPINQSLVVQQVLANAVAQQLSTSSSAPAVSSGPSFDFHGLDPTSVTESRVKSGEQKSQDWLKAKPDTLADNVHCGSVQQSRDSSSEEKTMDISNDSSLKPSDNSETDTSFYREKSMSANDQDSGSGSGTQSLSPPTVLARMMGLIESAEVVIKKQGDRLGELVEDIRKELREMNSRHMMFRMELLAEKRRSAHFHKRYAAFKYIQHHRRHLKFNRKTTESHEQ